MLSSELPTPPTSGEVSLLRRPRFWIVQVAGWLIIQPLYFRNQLEVAVREGLGGIAIAMTGASCLLAIACSTALAVLYCRVPPRWLTGVRAYPVAFGGTFLACVPWAAGMEIVGRATWLPDDWAEGFGFRFFAYGWVLMISWSGAFLWLMLSSRVRESQARALRAEALAQEARLLSLRAQLNPHFLFNSLNSVVGLIGTDPPRARQMVRDVAGLLRRTLDSTKTELTTIGDELDLVLQYLRCESVRFRERLEVKLEVSESLHGYSIPSMLLQPLVENAIKYGMKNARKLRLVLRGRLASDGILLEVRNSGNLSNGRSSRPTTLTLVDDEQSEGTGSGLRLVRQRLATTYPQSGRLELLEEEGWVVARIEFDPAEARPERDRLGATSVEGAA